jgi:hypothetical protein
MARTLCIMAVGTSLHSNTGGTPRASRGDVESLNNEVDQPPLGDLAGDERPCQHWRIGNCAAALVQLDPEEEVGYRPGDPARGTDRLPQELSYLWLAWVKHLCPEGGDTVDVALLASDDSRRDGLLCAAVLKRYLDDLKARNLGQQWEWPAIDRLHEVTLHRIEGLTPEDRGRFEDVGVPNLINQIQKLASGCHRYDRIVLNLTGGFKGAIPFVTIAGLFLPKVESHYLFESTRDVIVLPQYPVGLDYGLWQRQANLIRAACSQPERYRKALDERTRGVVDAEGGALTPFGGVLEREFERVRKRAPFQHVSESVIERLVICPGYRDRLNKVIDAGPLIWQADKAPMAAEHATRHHQHLLDFAEVALLPLKEERLLTDPEMFCLLAALLLHDCGHSLDAVMVNGWTLSLFPREVREYHNYLTWTRLRVAERAAEVNWDADGPLSDVVRDLCLYHRKGMGWCGKPSKWADHPLAKLAGWPDGPDFSKHEQGVDFWTLVVLLRLLDSCDNQTRRVGKALDINLTLKVFERDAEAWRGRAALLLPVTAEEVDGAPGWPRLRECLAPWASGRPRAVNPCDRCFREARGQLAALTLTDAPHRDAVIALEALRAYDEWAMRHNQRPHFDRHSFVREVQLLRDWSRPGVHYQVTLTRDAEADPEDEVGTRKTIEEDMVAEVTDEAGQHAAARFGGFSVVWQWADPCEFGRWPPPTE